MDSSSSNDKYSPAEDDDHWSPRRNCNDDRNSEHDKKNLNNIMKGGIVTKGTELVSHWIIKPIKV